LMFPGCIIWILSPAAVNNFALLKYWNCHIYCRRFSCISFSWL